MRLCGPHVHNSLVAAIRDALTPLVAPRYYVALGQRTYLLLPDDLELVFFGRPDLAFVTDSGPREGQKEPKKGQGGYRILLSNGRRRPRAQLYIFTVRDPIPEFPIPLLPGDEEPTISLGTILHGLYDRARFDLRIEYSRPPVPPVEEEDTSWAQALIAEKRRLG